MAIISLVCLFVFQQTPSFDTWLQSVEHETRARSERQRPHDIPREASIDDVLEAIDNGYLRWSRGRDWVSTRPLSEIEALLDDKRLVVVRWALHALHRVDTESLSSQTYQKVAKLVYDEEVASAARDVLLCHVTHPDSFAMALTLVQDSNQTASGAGEWLLGRLLASRVSPALAAAFRQADSPQRRVSLAKLDIKLRDESRISDDMLQSLRNEIETCESPALKLELLTTLQTAHAGGREKKQRDDYLRECMLQVLRDFSGGEGKTTPSSGKVERAVHMLLSLDLSKEHIEEALLAAKPMAWPDRRAVFCAIYESDWSACMTVDQKLDFYINSATELLLMPEEGLDWLRGAERTKEPANTAVERAARETHLWTWGHYDPDFVMAHAEQAVEMALAEGSVSAFEACMLTWLGVGERYMPDIVEALLACDFMYGWETLSPDHIQASCCWPQSYYLYALEVITGRPAVESVKLTPKQETRLLARCREPRPGGALFVLSTFAPERLIPVVGWRLQNAVCGPRDFYTVERAFPPNVKTSNAVEWFGQPDLVVPLGSHETPGAEDLWVYSAFARTASDEEGWRLALSSRGDRLTGAKVLRPDDVRGWRDAIVSWLGELPAP